MGDDVQPSRFEQHLLHGLVHADGAGQDAGADKGHRHLVLRRAAAEQDGDPAPLAHAFSSAWSKSAIMSPASSRPALTRIRPSPMPAARRASGSIWRCVVEAAWPTSVLIPPRLVATHASCRASQKRTAGSTPPSTSKASIPPNPLVSSRVATSW